MGWVKAGDFIFSMDGFFTNPGRESNTNSLSYLCLCYFLSLHFIFSPSTIQGLSYLLLFTPPPPHHFCPKFRNSTVFKKNHLVYLCLIHYYIYIHNFIWVCPRMHFLDPPHFYPKPHAPVTMSVIQLGSHLGVTI